MEELTVHLVLSIQDPGMTSSRVHALTREIIVTLNRQEGLEAGFSEETLQPGAKGDPVAMGEIALQLLGSGGAVAVLLNGVKSYFLRKQSLIIKLKRSDGQPFELHAENLNESQLARTLELLEDFLKG